MSDVAFFVDIITLYFFSVHHLIIFSYTLAEQFREKLIWKKKIRAVISSKKV